MCPRAPTTGRRFNTARQPTNNNRSILVLPAPLLSVLVLSGLFACAQETRESAEGLVDTVSGATPLAGDMPSEQIIVESGDQRLVLEG